MSIAIEIPPEAEEGNLAPGQIGGLVAAFATAGDVKAAAKAVRAAGYRQFEVHSPYPIHGIY